MSGTRYKSIAETGAIIAIDARNRQIRSQQPGGACDRP